MLTKIAIGVFTAGFLILLMGGTTYAQSVTRIKLNSETNSKTVFGTLAPGGSRTYEVRVRPKQEIRAVVLGRDLNLENNTRTETFSSPSGYVYIKVTNSGRGRTRYEMGVSLK